MMDNDPNITQIFVTVMHMVDLRRRANKYEDDIVRDCKRFNVDKRILDCLANEYERSKEESGYKMKSVPEIRELMRKADAGELD
jgi:hypothetical protein